MLVNCKSDNGFLAIKSKLFIVCEDICVVNVYTLCYSHRYDFRFQYDCRVFMV